MSEPRPPALEPRPDLTVERLLSEVVRNLRATSCCDECLTFRNGSPADTRLLNVIGWPAGDDRNVPGDK